MDDYICNGKFADKVLVVGRTACRKTYFVQWLAINHVLRTLKKVEWVSCIALDADREAEIGSCFSCEIEFHSPKGIKVFDDLLK